jgi:starch-binding outer membrane protein, SusD/RagB family
MRNKILILLLVSTVLLACERTVELNPVPTNIISDVTSFDTKERVEGQVRAIYATLKNGGWFGGRYQLFNEIRGGNFNNDRTNIVTGFDVWQYTTPNNSANSVEAQWARAYRVINLVNVFIDGMASKGTAVVGATLSNNYLAEARFVRALCYYGLLQLYARPFADGNGSKLGVPLRLIGATSSGDFSLARSTVAEVYTQILTDLNFAETNLPANYSTAALNVTRAHKNTAIALKTRVYLAMGRHADVVTEANKIVSAVAPFMAPTTGVAHALQADVRTPFTTFTTTESILSMPFASNETPGTQNALGEYYGTAALNGGSGEYSLFANGVIADVNWKATDRRRSFLIVNGGKTWLMKWPASNIFVDWAPVIRYPEILLNLAESLAQLSATVDTRSIALLNAVRQRSDATTTFAPATKADLIALILREREIELLGEGFSGSDLTRRLEPLPAKPGVNSVPFTSKQYVWPIAASELILNKLAVDN